MLIDAVYEMMLCDQCFKVYLGVVREEKEHARDEKFVVSVVSLQSVASFRSVSEVDEQLSRRFVQQ